VVVPVPPLAIPKVPDPIWLAAIEIELVEAEVNLPSASTVKVIVSSAAP
jgi:hypothetical protein